MSGFPSQQRVAFSGVQRHRKYWTLTAKRKALWLGAYKRPFSLNSPYSAPSPESRTPCNIYEIPGLQRFAKTVDVKQAVVLLVADRHLKQISFVQGCEPSCHDGTYVGVSVMTMWSYGVYSLVTLYDIDFFQVTNLMHTSFIL